MITKQGKKIGKFSGLHRRSLLWVGMAVLTLTLQKLIPDAAWDQWYYQGLFPWIRQTYDVLLGWSPIPMVYVVLAVILVRAARWVGEWKKGFWWQVSRLVGGIAAMVVFFYLFWGFNYGQKSLQDRLGYNLGQVTPSEIGIEFKRATDVLRQEAQSLPDRLKKDDVILSALVSDKLLRPDVEAALATLGVPYKGRVRVRQLWPDGFLLRWSTAGIYIPQTGEGHIDKGLLSVQKPFTIAHEMAHGYGVTDEGACNFIAWLACSQSRDPWIRYGGALTYWRYAAAEMPDDTVRLVMHTFPPVVTRSIQLVRENDKKYPDLMPRLRNAIYASYLERHGVKGGLKSYNYVVLMVSEYLKSASELQRPE